MNNKILHKKMNSILLVIMTKFVLIGFSLLFVMPLYASNPLKQNGINLGVIGETYSILEDDLLLFIQKRVQAMQQNGDWQRMQDKWKKQVSDHTDRPIPLANIHRTASPKTWDYDPSIVVPYDLKDQYGNVFAKAGTRVNPLSYITLHTALIFYNADDLEQVTWVKKINKQYAGKTKLILVSGSISEQEKIFHQPIYFDQQGKLTTTFHISQVPALVYQDGLRLKIAEVEP